MNALATPRHMQGVVPLAVDRLSEVFEDLAPGTWAFIEENLCELDPDQQRAIA